MTAATTTQPTVTDSRFNALKAKLRELFELDKSDLDFGIYRIMAAKNEEVTRFLDTQLRKIVTDTLGQFGEIETHNVQHELDQTIQTLKDNQVPDEQIENNPKVKDLRQQLKTSGGTSGAGLEADIYNHLYTFFSRYYDEGDFISQRRYKGDTYAIPYGGEEVVLHWANKDQYYIKSGEHHRDYAFKLPKNRRVQFKVVAATADPNNVKEDAKAKRRHILAQENPVDVDGNTLTLRFEYRAPTEAEKDRAGDNKVAIFGGKYAKSTKGDEREQFCADTEVLALEKVPNDWLAALTAKDATDAKPERTVLGNHLDRYTARNTFDYFIHKDLGGFLSRELDFYLKNEVLRLDDIANLPADHLAKVQGKIKAIRAVAKPLIDFIASLEDFQRSLWLKKKLVLNTHWLVTIDRVPDKLRDAVANNAKQREQWEQLGFKPDDLDEKLGPAWGTREYLDSCTHLVIDSSLFTDEWTIELLSSFENLDEATTGTLIQSENYGALSLCQHRFREQVDCVSIDPPYNTGGDQFVYKDGFQNSSWIAMWSDRIKCGNRLMKLSSAMFATIDDNEQAYLKEVCDETFGTRCRLPIISWKKRSSPDARSTIGSVHDWIYCYVKNPDAPKKAVGRMPLSEKRRKDYTNPDKDPNGPWASVDMTGMTGRATKDQFYDVTLPSGRVIGPPENRSWGFSKATFEQLRKDGRIWFGESGDNVPRFKKYLSEVEGQAIPTLWLSKEVGDNDEAQSEITALFAEAVFSSPKPTRLISRIVKVSTDESTQFILDYFAGSGTTGHAVINLNREDDGNRKFILVEMGDYFHTVLKPRIAKVIYSPNWKDGKAQSHDKGLKGGALVKCFAMESYEDALNNLPMTTDAAGETNPLAFDQLAEAGALRYALDLQHGPDLLNLDAFIDPWAYTIQAQNAAGETTTRPVDLVETFNYLLGLKVISYGRIRRFSAEFEKAKHDEGVGKLKVKGEMRADPDGLFAYQRIEGELLNGTRVLVVWRKLTKDAEQDAAALDWWMQHRGEITTQRPAATGDPEGVDTRPFQEIYLNGPVTLAQWVEKQEEVARPTVKRLEEKFKHAMFRDAEEAKAAGEQAGG